MEIRCDFHDLENAAHALREDDFSWRKTVLTESSHREKGLVDSKHVWFIFVLTHVLSCSELFDELNHEEG